MRKNRSAGVSPASEPRQLLLGQHDLCRLEAGDTFFLTTIASVVTVFVPTPFLDVAGHIKRPEATHTLMATDTSGSLTAKIAEWNNTGTNICDCSIVPMSITSSRPPSSPHRRSAAPPSCGYRPRDR